MRNIDEVKNCNHVLIALGGNIKGQKDSPLEQVNAAICEISQSGVEVEAKSKVYRTPSFPLGSGPDFVNAVLLCVTDLSPVMVLKVLHDIEARAGRTREQRWEPRVLDLDLLAVNDLISPDIETFRFWADLDLHDQKKMAPEELILPHPRLHERAFVLVPMMDVAPDWRHPVLGLTVAEMHAALDPAEYAEIIPVSQ